jgi:hypothetical protein
MMCTQIQAQEVLFSQKFFFEEPGVVYHPSVLSLAYWWTGAFPGRRG